ncbi:hypothetical protein AMECASPLE_031110 [Ameca splendens]|uniref:Sushi domain-containing protein n=1 Tax=Ameca splendens TaxID=208324 RepID=A0ABV0Y6F6_9TELE
MRSRRRFFHYTREEEIGSNKGLTVIGLLCWILNMSVWCLFLLSSFGFAITAQGNNCGPLGEVLNGQIDYPNGTQFGDKALITCNKGYKLVGKSEITCGGQQWLQRVPHCEVSTCAQPGSIENGSFSPMQEEPYSYRAVVEYSCNKGYTLNGSKQLICEENEEFTPSPPSCICLTI